MMTNILKKIWGKNKTDYEDATEHQSKDKNYFQIKFDNHENPENSFSFDSGNPKNVYYTGKSDEKNTPFNKHSETEFIMKPKRWHKNLQKKKELRSEKNFLEDPKNSLTLTKPSVLRWQNKDAYIYTVESKYYDDGTRPDLEFVIYIPIDTAVQWLKSSMDKTPEYISEQPNSTEPNEEKKEIKYGAEEEYVNRKYTIITEPKSDSPDSDEDDDEDDEDKKDKGGPKPNTLKEKKVRSPKKIKKKARRIVTTYEDDEDEISLGRLRPQENPKEPIRIVGQKKLY